MKRALALPLMLLLIAAGDPKTETEHVVAAGETLSGIAARAGVPMTAIAEANGLAEPYIVKTGKKLVIPRQRTHVVKKGETGFAIGFLIRRAFRADRCRQRDRAGCSAQARPEIDHPGADQGARADCDQRTGGGGEGARGPGQGAELAPPARRQGDPRLETAARRRRA